MFKIQLKITKHAKSQGNVIHRQRKISPIARDPNITCKVADIFINMLKDIKENSIMKWEMEDTGRKSQVEISELRWCIWNEEIRWMELPEV